MFEETSSVSCVRFVSVKNNQGMKRVRVNIIYERGLQTDQSRLIEWPHCNNEQLTQQTPRLLDFEGYNDQIPEWGGIEHEISTVMSGWVEDEEVYNDVTANKSAVSDSSLWSGESSSRWDCYQIPDYSFERKKGRGASQSRLRCPSVGDTNEYSAGDMDVPTKNGGKVGFNIIRNTLAKYPCRFSCDMNQQTSALRTGRTVFCRLCEVHVKSTLRRIHVYSCHLRRALYKCPACDISSTYHLSNVRVHIKKVHSISAEPICLKKRYENEINALLYSCFGDRSIFRRQDPEIVACVNDMLNSISNDSPAICSSFNVQDCYQMRQDQVIFGAAGRMESDEGQSIFTFRLQSKNTCRICLESNVKHLERHVLQHHVKRPMFLCPYCTFSSCYSPPSVKDHIKTQHSMLDPIPVDMRMEYAELIRSIYNRCFLNDGTALTNRIAFKKIQNSDK